MRTMFHLLVLCQVSCLTKKKKIKLDQTNLIMFLN